MFLLWVGFSLLVWWLRQRSVYGTVWTSLLSVVIILWSFLLFQRVTTSGFLLFMWLLVWRIFGTATCGGCALRADQESHHFLFYFFYVSLLFLSLGWGYKFLVDWQVDNSWLHTQLPLEQELCGAFLLYNIYPCTITVSINLKMKKVPPWESQYISKPKIESKAIKSAAVWVKRCRLITIIATPGVFPPGKHQPSGIQNKSSGTVFTCKQYLSGVYKQEHVWLDVC